MTLDEPFGEDANDFDEEGMAETVYEDIYLALYKMDGPESVTKLRNRILQRYAQGKALEIFRKEMMEEAFWERSSGREFSQDEGGSNFV